MLGAPEAFVFVFVWLYVGAMVVAGALAGLVLGWGFAALGSRLIADATGVAITARIGGRELGAVAVLVAVPFVLALLPASRIYRRASIDALR